jgi:hypothetical protein
MIASPALATGTWAALNHQPTFNADLALLLTDGTVLVHDVGGTPSATQSAALQATQFGTGHWWRLSPDLSGGYVNGTWTQVDSLPSGYAPKFFASAVLPDGRVSIQGGEYNGGGAVWTTLGAIYDPTKPPGQQWTSVNPPSGWSTVGDAPSTVLANGTFMLGNCCSTQAALFNASTLSWTATGSTLGNTNNEEGWTLLPSGDVLTVDLSPQNAAELYNPVTGTWAFTANNTPVYLFDPSNSETGPQVLMPSGSVFAAGGTGPGVAGHTALYGTNGLWTQGPDFPSTSDGPVDCEDAPGALLPNGNVLVAASPGGEANSVHFFEFDGANFTEDPRPTTPNAPTEPTWLQKFLVLPTGQVLLTDNTTNIQIYTPSGSPNSAWEPTISSVSYLLGQGNSYPITGTQFNGLSQGAAYGDDAQEATNYPLLRITMASGDVYYFRTHGHSTMAVATGSQSVSTTFDVPARAEEGPGTAEVIANGIASPPANVCITPSGGGSCPASCRAGFWSASCNRCSYCGGIPGASWDGACCQCEKCPRGYHWESAPSCGCYLG